MREAHRYEADRGSLVGYLRAIARNLVLRSRQRELRYSPLDDNEYASAGKSPDSLLDASRVHRAVLALPVHYREVVVLCDFEGLKYEEAALMIGCSAGTVASRLHRGHQLLRKRLGKERQPQ